MCGSDRPHQHLNHERRPLVLSVRIQSWQFLMTWVPVVLWAHDVLFHDSVADTVMNSSGESSRNCHACFSLPYRSSSSNPGSPEAKKREGIPWVARRMFWWPVSTSLWKKVFRVSGLNQELVLQFVVADWCPKLELGLKWRFIWFQRTGSFTVPWNTLTSLCVIYFRLEK